MMTDGEIGRDFTQGSHIIYNQSEFSAIEHGSEETLSNVDQKDGFVEMDLDSCKC